MNKYFNIKIDYSFRDKNLWIKHSKRKHRVNNKEPEQLDIPDFFNMSCEKCPATFDSFKHTQTHYLEEHKISKGYIRCCGMKLHYIGSFNEHIKWHLNPNLFRSVDTFSILRCLRVILVTNSFTSPN